MYGYVHYQTGTVALQLINHKDNHMAKLIYPTFYEALNAKGVTVEVFEEDENTWRVRVFAPNYMKKDFLLSESWSTSFTEDEVLNGAQKTLSKMYNVYHTSGYTTG